jgi:hypothetical protein
VRPFTRRCKKEKKSLANIITPGSTAEHPMEIGARLFLVCALGLGAALGSITSVTAQIDSKKLPAAKKAAASFADRAKGSEKTGEVPRLSDPAVKQLLDAVFDIRDIEAAKVIPFQALSPLSERITTATQVGLIYMLAGMGTSDIAQAGTDPAAGEKINLNVIKYPEEMGRYFDFAVTVHGAIAESVLSHMTSAKPADLARPNFQSGLANIRAGAARSISGVIETLAVNGLTDEWIRARLPALMVVAPKLSRFLLADQKEDLHKLALACADVTDDAQAKKGLQDFALAMAGG